MLLRLRQLDTDQHGNFKSAQRPNQNDVTKLALQVTTRCVYGNPVDESNVRILQGQKVLLNLVQSWIITIF